MTTYRSMREAAKRKMQHYDSSASPSIEGQRGQENKGEEKPLKGKRNASK